MLITCTVIIGDSKLPSFYRSFSMSQVNSLAFLNCIFRDINPNNIMINEKLSNDEKLEITLIDFNVSRRFRDDETNMRMLMITNTGAAAFTAPEIHNG